MSATIQAPERAWEALRERGCSGSRELSLRASSVNKEERSFEAVASTETPAVMVDWERYEYIDEILLAKGGHFPSQVVLLPNHQRYSLEHVIGSARNFRLEGEQWVCRGYVATKAADDDRVDVYWSRIAEGHLRAVSIGYQVEEFTDIPPGERKLVEGRYFTAKKRRLRVSTRWMGHELSLTPIGADPQALIRSKQGSAPAPVVTGFRTSAPQPVRSYFR